MKTTPEHDERMANMTFASVYPHYVTKVERKGRTKQELHQVIEWLTGFHDKKIEALIEEQVTFKIFFERAKLNPNAKQITGVICGYRIEEISAKPTLFIWGIKDPVIKPHYLDKFISGFPNSETIRLETSGHFPQEEQPEIVAKSMSEFLHGGKHL